MRFLLVMWLAIGLAPGLGEVAETVVHLATAGHLAHSDADHGDLGDQGHHHGCGTTQHQCGCCPSQAAAVPAGAASDAAAPAVAEQTPSGDALASVHEPTPPFRPPIAS